MKLCNALAISMLEEGQVEVVPISLDTARNNWRYIQDRLASSAVGHADTAALFAALLGEPVPVHRQSIRLLGKPDYLMVGQYSGPRLPEGATTLPDGAEIRWYIVRRIYPQCRECGADMIPHRAGQILCRTCASD